MLLESDGATESQLRSEMRLAVPMSVASALDADQPMFVADDPERVGVAARPSSSSCGVRAIVRCVARFRAKSLLAMVRRVISDEEDRSS